MVDEDRPGGTDRVDPAGGTDTRPRVLHVTQSVGGGVPQAIVDHVLASPMASHFVLCPPENVALATSLKGRAQVLPLPGGKLAQLAEYWRQRARMSPDLVIAHSSWAGLYARLWPTTTRIVYQPHAYVMEDPSRGALIRGIFKTIERTLAPRGGVLALTSREYRLAQELGSAATYLVPNTSHAPRRHGLKPDGPVVTCGRVCSQKDPAFFLEVAKIVRRHHAKRRFVWIGDGDARWLEELKAGGIEVTGWLQQIQVWDWLGDSAVYVHTARYEGLPLAVLDAAAVGLPLALRRIDAFEDYEGAQGETPEEVAEIIVASLDDAQETAAQRSLADMYWARFEPSSQEAALRGFYRSELGVGLPLRATGSDRPTGDGG